jgi:malate permease and related proteins
MTAVLLNAIPILLLISFGFLIKKKQWLLNSTVDEIKKGVINVALPAVLFQTFINMELKREYFGVMVLTFVLMLVFFSIGTLLNRIPSISHPLTPFMTSACTFGLLGIPLYGTVFGMENLGKISILGVGHEFFVWFVYYTIMEMQFCKRRFSVKMAKGFIKSPLILAILLGIFLNVTGYGKLFQINPLLKGIYNTIQSVGNLATPSILMIVGYGLKFEKSYMKHSARFVILRYSVILTAGYIFKYLFVNRLIGADSLFDYAYFTFMILPPPMSLSVFVGKYGTGEQQNIVNNTAVLCTVFSVAVFLIFIIATGLVS